MNKYMIVMIVATIIFIIINLIIVGLSKGNGENKIKKSKKKGVGQPRQNRYATNSIKQQLENILTEKASVKKRYKIETLCIQAGHKMSYGEYMLLSLITSITIPILIFLVTKNFFLIIVFAIIGFNIPGQYIKIKANKKLNLMNKQVGSFLRVLIERYKVTKDMSQSITQSLPDFKGLEPFYTHLKGAVSDLQLGKPIDETLDSLVRATGNKYLSRFTDYYKMTGPMATHEGKVELLLQAYTQYDDNEKLKFTLKEKISGPVKEAYIMVAVIPIFFFYQSFFTEGYLEFMLHDKVGQLGFAGSISLLIGCVIFINKKIGAPIE